MNRVRHCLISIVGIILALFVFLFIKSLGSTYIETNHSSYEIEGMKNGNSNTEFNRVIENYTKKHNISAIKVFNVVDSGSDDIISKMHVYGKNIALPKNTRANNTEFLTSDIRYPLYFVGKTNPDSIQKMFKENGIKYERINESWNTDILVFLSTNNIGELIVLILMILAIVLILSNLKELKKINIRSLMGMSKLQDSWDSFKNDQIYFIGTYFISLLILSIYMRMTGYLNSYRIMLYFALILYVVVTLIMFIVAMIRAGMHSRFTIVNAIKGNENSRLSFNINLIFKIIIEVFVCIVFASLLSTLKQEQKLASQLDVWNKSKTFYTVNLSPIGLNRSESEDLSKKSLQLYKYLTDRKGMFVDYTNWDRQQDITDLNNGNVMQVNAEYLRNNRIVDTHNKRILFSDNAETTYILIPKKYASQQKEISQSYRDSLGINDAEKRLGRKLKSKIILIKNNQRPFSYSIDAISLGYYDGKINSPAIVVISNKSLGGMNLNLDTNINWDAYLSDSSFLSPSLTDLKNGIKRTKITKYIGSLINTKSYAYKELKNVRQGIYFAIVTIVLAVVIAVIENLSFNTIYFNNHRKKLAIQRLMGANFLQRFGRFLLTIVLISLLEAIVVVIFTGNWKIAVGLFIITNLIECMLIVLQTNKLNNQVEQAIKGE